MSVNMIVKCCDKIVIGGVVLMAFIPLCVDNNIYNCYLLSKVLWMYALTSILLGTWIIKMIALNDFRSVRTPLDFPIFAFLTCNILSTIFSIAPIISLMGTYSRYDGLLTFICYIVQYYLVVNFFQTKRSILWLLSVIVAVGTISGVYGIFQYFEWVSSVDLYRMSSFFGNPIFYSAYTMMTFLIGLGLYFSFSQRKLEHLPGEDNRRHSVKRPGIIVLCVCLLIIYWGFSVANTRSSYLGIYAGIITFLCLSGKEILLGCKKRLIVLGIGVIIIFSYYNFIEAEYSVIQRFTSLLPAQVTNNEISNNGPMTDDKISDNGPASPFRVFIWKTGMEIFKDYPVLGIGPETIGLVFFKYLARSFPEKYALKGEYTNRMHNELLEYAVTRGIVGLIIYLWGVLSFFVVGWRFYKNSSLADRPIMLIFIVVALALLVQVQFNFSVPELSCPFVILAGGMIVMGRQSILSLDITQKKGLIALLLFSNCLSPQIRQYPKRITHGHKTFRRIYCVITIGAIVCFLMFIYRIYMADKHYLIAKQSSKINTIIYEYQQASALVPYEMEYYDTLTQAYLQKTLRMSSDKTWTKDAIVRTKQILQYIPLKANAYFVLGLIDYILARDENDPRIQDAIKYYKTTIELNPFFVHAHYNMANIYYKQKRYDMAIKYFKHVRNLVSHHTSSVPSLYRLAECYAIKGNAQEASKYLKELKEVEPDYPTVRLQGMIDGIKAEKSE